MKKVIAAGAVMLTVLLVTALGGCASGADKETKLDLAAACRIAGANIGDVRVVDMLRRLAARHVSREDFRTEIKGFAGGIASGVNSYDAFNDPRFLLGMEVVRYCRYLLLMPPESDPAEFFREDALRELAYEQLAKWSKLLAAIETAADGRISAGAMDIELELAQSLNCSRDELRKFDYRSLPEPSLKDKLFRKKDPLQSEPLETAVEILELTGVPALQLPRQAVEKMIDQELELLKALAEKYAGSALDELAAAEKKNDNKAASAALCRWRLAIGRLEQLR